jgi:hypothetical protein
MDYERMAKAIIMINYGITALEYENEDKDINTLIKNVDKEFFNIEKIIKEKYPELLNTIDDLSKEVTNDLRSLHFFY